MESKLTLVLKGLKERGYAVKVNGRWKYKEIGNQLELDLKKGATMVRAGGNYEAKM